MDCSVAQTLELIGEWWTLLILRNAFHGMRTFDEFQEKRRTELAEFEVRQRNELTVFEEALREYTRVGQKAHGTGRRRWLGS